MAITKTQKLISVTYREDMVTIPQSLYVEYQVTIDDPDDVLLPIYTAQGYTLLRDSDITNEEELVKNIFNLVFKIVQ